jgi:hypothetical protein
VEYTSGVGYADSLVKLGPGTPCNKAHACLSDILIGCITQPCLKSGYSFFLTSSSGAEPFGDYTSTATPTSWQNSGSKNFCSSDDGVIRSQANATASLGSAAIHSDCTDSTQFRPLGG